LHVTNKLSSHYCATVPPSEVMENLVKLSETLQPIKKATIRLNLLMNSKLCKLKGDQSRKRKEGLTDPSYCAAVLVTDIPVTH
jgi:hypothetical protein